MTTYIFKACPQNDKLEYPKPKELISSRKKEKIKNANSNGLQKYIGAHG